MERWFEEAEVNTDPRTVALYLVGAKTDKPNRAVSAEEGKRLAEAHGAHFCEASAKNGEGVRRPFVEIVDEVVSKGAGGSGRSAGTVKVGGEAAEGGWGSGCSC